MLTLEERADENCRVWKEGSGSETDVWPSNLGIRRNFFFFTTVLKYRGRGLTNKGRQRGRRHVSRKEQYFCPDSKQLPNKPQK